MHPTLNGDRKYAGQLAFLKMGMHHTNHECSQLLFCLKEFDVRHLLIHETKRANISTHTLELKDI